MKTQTNIKSNGMFAKLIAATLLLLSLTTACEKTEITSPSDENTPTIDVSSAGDFSQNAYESCQYNGEELIHGGRCPK